MTEISSSVPLILKDCTVLGASGFPFSAGDTIVVVFNSDTVSCKSNSRLAKFSFLELADISIAGPGAVVTGGGFIGGGFGVEGAIEGIAIAGALNALTAKKKIHTLITLTANFGELHLHYGAMEPGALRIFLSEVFVGLRRLDSQWIQARKKLIDDHLAAGLIATEDAGALMDRLASPPAWAYLGAETDAQQLLDEKTADAGPKGLCPSCDKTIPLHSEACRHCKANFGQYSSWQVIPIG